MKNRNKKAGVAIAAASVITAGAVTVAAAYQSGMHFQPKDSNRKFQNNQVVFSDNKDQVEDTEDDNGDDSELWEKNQDDEQNNNQEDTKQSDYLFQKELQNSQAKAVTVGVNSGDASGNNDPSAGTQNGTGSQNGGVYNLTGDTSNADIIINGNGTGQITDPNGTGSGTGTGTGGTGQNNTNGTSNNSGTNTTPSTDEENNGNNNSNNNHGTSDTKRPSATAKDPEVKKTWPSDMDQIINNVFPDTGISDIADDATGVYKNVMISPRWQGDVIYLYKGQTIDQTLIYNSLDTYVYSNDRNNRYVWGEKDLNQFVRIDAVSFDGGTTWKNNFPLTIPTTVTDDTMIIKVSFRLSKDKPWTERLVSYELKGNRIFVLSQEIKKQNAVIDTNTILNYSNQNPEVGSIMNLYRLQADYLGENTLTELFPGWMEDGTLVPWLYSAPEGRHILEPAKSVPLSKKYTAQLNVFWMTNDWKIDPDGNNLVYLQTLTGFSGNAITRMKDGTFLDRVRYNELVVPEYIQAVAIDASADLEVDYLKIPDTVIYLADSSAGLHVNRGYLVDENNPVYQSTKEGVLLNKEATEILGIPYELEKLVIPATISNVELGQDNQISEIEIKAKTLDAVPKISYKTISHCKFVVPESYMEDFLKQNNAQIRTGSGNCVASVEDPDVTYTMKSGIILSNQGDVRRIIADNNTSVTLPDTAAQINRDAFSKGTGIDTLILPKNGCAVHLEAGSLNGSNVTSVWCYSREQYDTIKEELSRSGTDRDVSVELLQESKEGYYYKTSDTGVILMNVPDDLTSFDGTMTDSTGASIAIDAIAEHAFENCQKLEWVTLPESVKKIGYKAFADCTGLQGALINSTDSITIGNEAFSGCDSLRFLASNATEGIMEDGYAPSVTDKYGNQYFYIPTNATGYCQNCIYFTEQSGVASYAMEDIGGTARMLYGVDADGNPGLALRSGGNVPDQVTLPESTMEFFDYAMADTKSPSGSYSVNWDEMPDLHWLDRGAFCNSDLGGEVTLPGDYYCLKDRTMAGCKSMISFTVSESIYLEGDVFQNCSRLTQVTFGEVWSSATLNYGVFTGCDSLRDIYFNSETIPQLMVPGTSEYQFNADWSEAEEEEKLRVHVPENEKESYVRGWRYAYAGYIGYSNQSAYDRMWQDIRQAHRNPETWEFPSDEEVDAYAEEALLQAENRVRKTLGMEEVSKSSEWYEYTINNSGIVTLTGVPSYCTEAKLDAETLGLSAGSYLDNIGAGAFSRAKNLKKVTIPSTLSCIYENILRGVGSDSVTIEFEPSGEITTPENIRFSGSGNGIPFSFGIDDRRIHLKVPEGTEEACIEAWKYMFAGYDSEDDMRMEIMFDLIDWETWEWPSDEEVEAEMNRRLVEPENRLRAMMGLPLLNTDTSENSGEVEGNTENLTGKTEDGAVTESVKTDDSAQGTNENEDQGNVTTVTGNPDAAASGSTDDADGTDADPSDSDSATTEESPAETETSSAESGESSTDRNKAAGGNADADTGYKNADASIPKEEDTQK